ncbi:MAG: GntR family transcriptional regulator [Desulfosarcinaceae bacterium]|nr:GntR family transcriptional regulator [Desulfosarcinaceae bacterium]
MASNPSRSGKLSMAQTAYATLRRKITSLSFEPGEPLAEGPLVEMLGIGRTPVREALLQLAADLLVEAQPGKGFVVRPITLQNTKAAFAALEILELGVARLAVRRDIGASADDLRQANAEVARAVADRDVLSLVEANARFHSAYAACSGNLYLINGLQRVRCETDRLAFLSYGNEISTRASLSAHYDSVLAQHAAIIAALEARKLKQLEQIVVSHIDIFKKRMIDYLLTS